MNKAKLMQMVQDLKIEFGNLQSIFLQRKLRINFQKAEEIMKMIEKQKRKKSAKKARF